MNRVDFLKGFFLAAILAAGGCGQGGRGTGESAGDSGSEGLLRLSAEQAAANNLVLGSAVEYDFLETVTASGYLEALPRNIRTVATVTGGTIRDLNLLPGDRVRVGEMLFRIVSPALLQLQEEYLSVSEQLKYLEEEFKRQETLAGENVSAQKVLSRAQGDYLSARARVEALRSRLALTGIATDKLHAGEMVSAVTVFSPIGGYVTRVESGNGKVAPEGTEIIEITATTPLLLRLAVFEKDIIRVSEGQEVRFTLPDVSADTLLAKIIRTGRVLDENRTVDVYALFDVPENLRLLPGMFGKAVIITGSRKTRALPLTALIEGDDLTFVLVKSNTSGQDWILSKKTVRTGMRDETMVEILPEVALSPDEQVVVSGVLALSAL